MRAVGQSIFDFVKARVPWSVWRIVADRTRGLAIEKAVLGRPASFLGRAIENFKVIEFVEVKESQRGPLRIGGGGNPNRQLRGLQLLDL